MVAKKRCDFCLKIKPDNLQADQTILNKSIEKILLNISGLQVTSEQLSTILTCFDCALCLIQAEPFAVKARNLLGRLLKPKGKKRKTTAVNGTLDASKNEQSTHLESNETHPEDETLANKTPKKIAARRKSTATSKKTKVQNDSVFNDDGLDGNPAASSTMAVISASTPAGEKKETKKNSPKKTATKLNGKNDVVTTVDSGASKANKRKISVSEKTKNNSQNESSFAISKPAVKRQRAISGEGGDEDSQNSNNGEVGECMECGKRFFHVERYEAHVLGQKCKNAAFACKDPNCLRRFYKLKKMHEHLQRKHPDLLENESLDG